MKRIRIQERKDSWIFEKSIVLAQDEKFSPTANTDNKVNLLVTVFAFTPASYNMTNNLIPRSRLCSFKTQCTLTYDLLATNIVPRHS